MISDGDYGWGDSGADEPRALGGIGSTALIVASSLYCTAVWLASGLPPIAYLASTHKVNNHMEPARSNEHRRPAR